MRRSTLLLFSLVLPFSDGTARGTDGPTAGEPRREIHPPPRLAAEVWAVTDIVLDHHIDPPTRQQMILDGLRALYRSPQREATEPSLARRVSEISSAEALGALLEERWPMAAVPVDGNLLHSLLANVPGEARRGLTKEFAVEEQLTGNLYVGLQIGLGYDNAARRPQVASVAKGGPADLAGMKAGDRIEEIDGESTERMNLYPNVIDRLRGPLGSRVVLRVRQPDSPESRTLEITRGMLPRTSVEGVRATGSGGSELLLQGPGAIGYIKLMEISGSTPTELRAMAQHFEEYAAKALILDLRPARQASLHPAVLVADEVLETGTIGRVRTARRVETFSAEPDALFRDLPLAVLVNEQTSGPTALLAAALQDNHRAALVGSESRDLRGRGTVIPPTRPEAPRSVRTFNRPDDVATVVPIGDGTWSIKLTTGRLERGDGKALALLPDILARGRAAAGSDTDPQVRDDPVLGAAVVYLRQMLKLP